MSAEESSIFYTCKAASLEIVPPSISLVVAFCSSSWLGRFVSLEKLLGIGNLQKTAIDFRYFSSSLLKPEIVGLFCY